jgi:hypothetical protein
MMNVNRLKKLYEKDLLNNPIVFNECKDYLTELVEKGYSYSRALKLLEIELKENGVNVELKTSAFFRWKKKTNFFVNKSNLNNKEVNETKKNKYKKINDR